MDILPEELLRVLASLRRKRWTGHVAIHFGDGRVSAYDVTERMTVERLDKKRAIGEDTDDQLVERDT